MQKTCGSLTSAEEHEQEDGRQTEAEDHGEKSYLRGLGYLRHSALLHVENG